MTTPAAKFFVNQGVVSSRTDMLHLLRPLLKQTVTYRYLRGREVISHGTGWVERIVVDADDISTYFTPLAITLNIESFEHLEFETRPDQLLVYALVQGDERVVVEFAPVGPGTQAGQGERHGGFACFAGRSGEPAFVGFIDSVQREQGDLCCSDERER